MPKFYKISKEHRLVLSTACGVITKEDIIAHHLLLSNDPNFDPHYSLLSDLRLITKLELSEGDVRHLMSQSVFAPESRLALVVKEADSQNLRTISEQSRDTAATHGLRIFCDLDEAMEWILAPVSTYSS
jgi:hypothetical protein